MDTCFLAFGYIAAYATPSLITTRIDVHILNNIKLHLPAVKTPERKTVHSSRCYLPRMPIILLTISSFISFFFSLTHTGGDQGVGPDR